MKKYLVRAFLLLALSFPFYSKAQDRIKFAVGAFDILGDDTETTFSGTYRFGEFDLAQFGMKQGFVDIHPIAGLYLNTEGGIYGFAGLEFEKYLTPEIVLNPSFAVGYYDDNGQSTDLGLDLEFRSGIEVLYEMPNGVRVGPGFYHLSNASLGEDNPGTEMLMLNFSVPFANFLR